MGDVIGVEAWLQSLGLGHHVQSFALQDVGLEQRGDLTDGDLRELGLTIGERIRFRRAVAALTPAQAAAPAPPGDVLASTRAEHRPLTTMFVDMVNSSGLAERLEPEDLLEAIRAYREICSAAIVRIGGHVAQLIGDGVLAYFGYPQASESDPERAVRAALGIVAAIGGVALPDGAAISVRIGIATGRVIVSDLFTAGQADKAAIIGTTPNLAARLQQFAPPNGIVIADETHARVENRFLCDCLGSREIRGFAQPATPWLVRSEMPAHETAAAARAARRLTPFFNRRAELAVLDACWKSVRGGEGRTVLLKGEAGIGKSRLVEHFLATQVLTTQVSEGGRVLRLAGSSFDEDTPFHPWLAHVRAQMGAFDGLDPPAALARLATVLGEPEDAGGLPIVAELLGLALVAPARPGMAPDERRARSMAVMLAHLLREAGTDPFCLVIEDAHWLDPSTHELLGLLLEQIADRRTMLLLTVREGALSGPLSGGVMADWLERCKPTVLHLNRLAPNHVAEMVASLFGAGGADPELARRINRKTDGVPLFVEEVTRELLERAAAAIGDGSGGEGPGQDGPGGGGPGWGGGMADTPDPAIPDSLRESLMARLDRSGTGRQIAQFAAVVGRSVTRDLLLRVSDVGEAELDRALAVLVHAGVIDRDLAETRESYSFRHALLRDAAYDSLLREPRRQMHARVAEALRAADPPTAEQQPEVLALHLTEAGLIEAATPFWLEAARRSLARSALTEASRMLRRALDALERLAETPAVIGLRLQASGLLGPALMALRGSGSEATTRLYHAAYELSQKLPEEACHFPVYWGWWRVSPDYHAQIDRSAALLKRAELRCDGEFMLQAHHCNWASHYHAGALDRCAGHIAAGLAIYHAGDYRHHAALYGNHDAKACGHGELAQVLWMQGRARGALVEEQRSLAWAQALDHLGSRLHAMDFSLLNRVYRGEIDQVAVQAAALIAVTSDAGLVDHAAKAQIFRGWSQALSGDGAAGLAALRAGLSRQSEIGTNEDGPVYVCMLADALIAAGQPEAAVTELRAARRDFEAGGLRVWLPEVLRMEGEALLAADTADMAGVDALFAAATALAREQGAAMLALRTAVSAARLDLKLDRLDGTALRLQAALRRLPEREGADVLSAERVLARLPPLGPGAIGLAS